MKTHHFTHRNSKELDLNTKKSVHGTKLKQKDLRFRIESGKPVWWWRHMKHPSTIFHYILCLREFFIVKLKQSVKFSAELSNHSHSMCSAHEYSARNGDCMANSMSIKSYNNCCKHKFQPTAYVLKLNRKSLHRYNHRISSAFDLRTMETHTARLREMKSELCLLRGMMQWEITIATGFYSTDAANFGPNLWLIYCVGLHR